MLVVDFMHEVKLGVWKTLFTHLIRILYKTAPNGKTVALLDERYAANLLRINIELTYNRFHQVSQFGETICQFSNNVSEMKKLAACDYEDLLQVRTFPLVKLRDALTSPQCSIPAFEGLLKEPHNRRLMKLLFWTAEWHSFAKLRMHTVSTLDHLETLTKDFGKLMRQFHNLTCLAFPTFELPCEVEARKRQLQHAQTKISGSKRKPKKVSASTSSSTDTHCHAPPPESMPAISSTPSSRKPKMLNIMTPKFHFLGDYIQTIWMFGCTDSFSTQIVWKYSSLYT